MILVYLKILEHLNTHHNAINKDSVKITKRLTPGMGGAVRTEISEQQPVIVMDAVQIK